MTIWLAFGAAVLVVGLVGWGVYAWRDVRFSRCPKTGNRVRLRVVADPVTGWLTNVTACSALEGERTVSCGKSCVSDCDKH